MSQAVEVVVHDRMQDGYRYARVVPMGGGFDPGFEPELSPAEMLELGVFCGKYMTDCQDEFPVSWFEKARLAQCKADCSLNYYGIRASKPLSEWVAKGWIHPGDPRDPFCRPRQRQALLQWAYDARQL